MITKEFNFDNALFRNNCYGSNSKIYTCGNCNHIFTGNINNKIKHCPECKQVFDFVFELQGNVSFNCYSSSSYLFIEKLEYDNDSFYMKMKQVTNGLDLRMDALELVVAAKETDKKTIEIIMNKEPLKTKEGYRFKAKIIKDNQEYKLLKGDSELYSHKIINIEELIRTRLCSTGGHTSSLIWEIYKNYKDYPKFIKYGIGYLSNKADSKKIIRYIEESDYYYDLIKKETEKHFEDLEKRMEPNEIRSKSNYYYNSYYASSLLIEYPCTNPKYYEMVKTLKDSNEYYIINSTMNTNLIRNLVGFFINADYTENEAKALLELAYKQAIPFSYLTDLNDMYEVCKSLNIPFDKIPKEIDIYIRRGEYLRRYIYRGTPKSTNVEIKNKQFSLDLISTFDTLKKAISYSNNFNLTFKLLNEHFGNKADIVANIKDTDYIICTTKEYGNDNSKKIYIKMYDKEKEITDENKILDILNSLEVQKRC